MQGLKFFIKVFIFYETFFINHGNLGIEVKPSKCNFCKLNKNI
jgi:hypothetical protein